MFYTFTRSYDKVLLHKTDVMALFQHYVYSGSAYAANLLTHMTYRGKADSIQYEGIKELVEAMFEGCTVEIDPR